MKDKLNNIYELATKDIEQAQTSADLEDVKLKYLSRKGEFNAIKKGLKDLSVEEKKVIGSLANEITQKLETALKEKSELFYRKELQMDAEYDTMNKTPECSIARFPCFPTLCVHEKRLLGGGPCL